MTYTLEYYLMDLHPGQWFGFSDSKNKVYANLVIHNDDYDKPSESDWTNGVAALQTARLEVAPLQDYFDDMF